MTLLGSSGAALADAAPTTLSAPRYVEQSNPSRPNSYDDGYEVGKQLGKQAADADFKHGQMSRAFLKKPALSSSDPNYNYQDGVLQGTKQGYTNEINKLLGGTVGPENPYYPAPAETPSPSCGACATSPNTTNPGTGGSSPASQTPTGPVLPVV